MTIKDLIENLQSYPADMRLATRYQNGREVIVFPSIPAEPMATQTAELILDWRCVGVTGTVLVQRNRDGTYLARSHQGDAWVQPVEYALRFESEDDAKRAARNFNPCRRPEWLSGQA